MQKQKHRVVVDLSFDTPVTGRYAARALQLILDDADKERSLQHWQSEMLKADVKEGQRAIQQEVRKALAARDAVERQIDADFETHFQTILRGGR